MEIDLVLPMGWRDLTVPVKSDNMQQCTGHCLEPHDMAAAKVAAGRDKDRLAVVNLMRKGILKVSKLRERVRMLDEGQIFDGYKLQDLIARMDRWERVAFPPKSEE